MQVNQNAPVFQAAEILIQASPERVWMVLTDIQQWPTWNPNISRAKLDGPLSVAAKFNWKVKGASIRSILHTVDVQRAFGWSGTTFGGSAIHNWYLETHNGHTLVRVEESMEGWLVNLFKNKMNRDLATDMFFWLEKLKEASEKRGN
jgi:uncharacterized protein YndB with AHSA1/START domain